MSDNILRIIPVDIDYVPDELARIELGAFLRRAFPRAQHIELRATSKREFIDPGANLITIACPHCAAFIKDEWWQASMDKAYESLFDDLRIDVPCCSRPTSLDKLVYDWPAGFARFVAEIRGPGRDMDATDMVEVEQIIGRKARLVRAHY